MISKNAKITLDLCYILLHHCLNKDNRKDAFPRWHTWQTHSLICLLNEDFKIYSDCLENELNNESLFFQTGSI